jgi:hypothetical protein
MEPGANLFLRDVLNHVTADTLHPLIHPDLALPRQEDPTLTIPLPRGGDRTLVSGGMGKTTGFLEEICGSSSQILDRNLVSCPG